MVTVERKDVKHVIKSLLLGKDYREDFLAVIDSIFFTSCVDFLKKITTKDNKNKQSNLKKILQIETTSQSEDKFKWYKELMLNPDLGKIQVAHNAGLNMKTIKNMHNSEAKKIVIESAHKHFNQLINLLKIYSENINQLDVKLNVEYDSKKISLDIFEFLIILNAMAVKKSAIRGGAYSSIGQQIEAPLMITLARLLKVPKNFYTEPTNMEDSARQVDFYFYKDNNNINCEIKLMGSGNPESTDSGLARYSHIFIANKISKKGKTELDKRNILWLETQGNDDLLKSFSDILTKLEIPHTPFNGDYTKTVELILDKVLDDLNY